MSVSNRWIQLSWSLVSLAVLAGLLFGAYMIVTGIWTAFSKLKLEIAVAIVAATTTVLVSVLTVVLGKYFERQREVEAHFRDRKLALYEQFLDQFFRLFQEQDQQAKPDDANTLTQFLKEWQKRIVLRGSPGVLKAYFNWKNHVTKEVPDADSLFLMDEFFRELRADVGQSSRGLRKGAFSNLILRQAPLFLHMAKKNPKLRLTELAEVEKKLYGE